VLKAITSLDRVRHLEGANLVRGQHPRNLHGKCENPIEILLIGLPDQVAVDLGQQHPDEKNGGKFFVPCRKCTMCLKSRRNLWASRASVEHRFAVRTWFVTLTFGPDARQALLWAARREQTLWGNDFEALSLEEQFKAIERLSARHLTLFFKRVRKRSSAMLRYFAVPEPHKDGMPHYHMLIHECGGSVTKRELQSSWPLGFSDCKLSDDKSVWYVAKYLGKYSCSRVRASSRYGDEALAMRRATSSIFELVGHLPPPVM